MVSGPGQFHLEVKAFRIERGWTLTRMAEYMGVSSENTIRNWERRESFPELGDHRDRVCEVLGLDHATLHDQWVEYRAYRASLGDDPHRISESS